VPVAVEGHVAHLATLALTAGCDGVVASVQEAPRLRLMLGPAALIVAPGIRPADATPGDQVRVATPAAAIRAGVDLLVVGRPITGADDPASAAQAILRDMGG
jgi:orotidine-5'-phosphate decarboxylase